MTLFSGKLIGKMLLIKDSQYKEVWNDEATYGQAVRASSVSMLCEKQSPQFRNLSVDEPSKNHLAEWFFSSRARTKCSQDDHNPHLSYSIS